MTPIERLNLGRELATTRDADIIAARDAGHPWKDIMDATGLSRAMCARIYRHQRPRSESGPEPVRTPRT
ncbi:hypothetical protein AB0O80_10520 [Rothia kristinae]|uniref:hypothetical protein n=1 Tax=Actinomycetes TaxID=1760 RepID=UPI003428FF1D